MATRGNIGIINEDGSVTGIYVHWDSYPEHVGKLLLNHYTNSGIVNELMDLGNLSYLDKNLYCEDNNHSFNNPADGVCVAYGRDRGEKNVNSKKFISDIEYKMDGKGVDYQYLFNNNKWYYRNVNKTGSTFVELTARVCKCD
jgi:hypothetical protein